MKIGSIYRTIPGILLMERGLFLSLFLPAVSVDSISREYNIVLASSSSGTQFDVFKLGSMPSQKVKVVVQQYGD